MHVLKIVLRLPTQRRLVVFWLELLPSCMNIGCIQFWHCPSLLLMENQVVTGVVDVADVAAVVSQMRHSETAPRANSQRAQSLSRDMNTSVGTGLRAVSSSAADSRPGAGWGVLLHYLGVVGLSERQLEDVQSMLNDIRFQDIDISVSRMGGEPLDLTISCYFTAACLKNQLAGLWTIQSSSLQLAIGTRLLDDSDVVAAFLSSIDRVVDAVIVRAPRLSRDRHGVMGSNTDSLFIDEVNLHLQNVACYMDAGEHQHLVMLWEQSCQCAQESCEAAACVLSRLSNPTLGRYMFDGAADQLVKLARKVVRDAIVYKVQARYLINIPDFRKMSPVFQSLASYAGCPVDTVSQLLNGARQLSADRLARQEERPARQVHGRMGGLVDQNVARRLSDERLAPQVYGGMVGLVDQSAPGLDFPNVFGGVGQSNTITQIVNGTTCVVGGLAALNALNAPASSAEHLCEQVTVVFLELMD